jgi:hypothetical protein
MTLFPDFARPLMTGVNVKTPIAVLGAEAYRLTLYPELGRDDRSVLVIGMTLQFQFEDADNGLKWFVSEQRKFADGSVAAIKSVWDDKWRITTTSTAPHRRLRDVGVLFALKTYHDGWHSDDDFEIAVKKVPAGTADEGVTQYRKGNASMNSTALEPVRRGGRMTQRAVVHEFGHMLGLNDEYDTQPGFIDKLVMTPNRNWLSDQDSIMNAGERVRPRHYVPFATWLTQQLVTVAKLTASSVTYKVDGLWDASNAQL